MAEKFNCWKCGNKLIDVILPMSRREECTSCAADQHVCKMCEFYDGNSRGSCNEERAESVSDSGRANFCDYFKPSNGSFKATARIKSEQAKAKFAALFSDDPADSASETSTSEYMQESPGQNAKDIAPLTSKQLAEQKLRDLLGS